MRIDDLSTELAAARHLAAGHEGAGIGLQTVALGRRALDTLSGRVAELAGSGPIVILEDAVPMLVDSQELKPLAAELLESVGSVRRVVLGCADGTLHADAATIRAAAEATVGAGCVVTVGSGTLTDIGKEAARTSGAPLVAVQSAASVNGYADGLAVVLRDGVKRTVPSAWPSALIVDTGVLRSAPTTLTCAGFAEMMTIFTAPADWRLASGFGFDRFDPAVVDLFRNRGEALLQAAASVRAGEVRALELLATLLTISGLAMGITGGTAPLSGAEHLVSHLLDMAALTDGRPVGLHGAQVGVASVIAACIWEHLLESFDPDDIMRPAPDDDDIGRRMHDTFAALDPSGKIAAECWSDYQLKLVAWRSAEHHRRLVADAWSSLEMELRDLIVDPALIAKGLAEAHAPARFCELDPHVPAATARWAVSSCHLMRRRFTVVDLAFLTGRWSTNDVDAVLDRAAAAGGGL